jgi:hypothetical protein
MKLSIVATIVPSLEVRPCAASLSQRFTHAALARRPAQFSLLLPPMKLSRCPGRVACHGPVPRDAGSSNVRVRVDRRTAASFAHSPDGPRAMIESQRQLASAFPRCPALPGRTCPARLDPWTTKPQSTEGQIGPLLLCHARGFVLEASRLHTRPEPRTPGAQRPPAASARLRGRG